GSAAVETDKRQLVMVANVVRGDFGIAQLVAQCEAELPLIAGIVRADARHRHRGGQVMFVGQSTRRHASRWEARNGTRYESREIAAADDIASREEGAGRIELEVVPHELVIGLTAEIVGDAGVQ